jgi:hypothetical protein
MKPILFSTEMVKAILTGRKTMTRRVVKPQPAIYEGGCMWGKFNSSCPTWWDDRKKVDTFLFDKCPYGEVGDVLWVRETWSWDWSDYPERKQKYYYYKATTNEGFLASGEKWRPSIFMPKDACRLFLKITDMRVERLHDITEEDAKAEGVQPNCTDSENCPSPKCKADGCQAAGEYVHYMRDFDDFPAGSATESFESLWHKINGQENWDANPWVWVISFEVSQKPC